MNAEEQQEARITQACLTGVVKNAGIRNPETQREVIGTLWGGLLNLACNSRHKNYYILDEEGIQALISMLCLATNLVAKESEEVLASLKAGLSECKQGGMVVPGTGTLFLNRENQVVFDATAYIRTLVPPLHLETEACLLPTQNA